jgi:hypothetical protein
MPVLFFILFYSYLHTRSWRDATFLQQCVTHFESRRASWYTATPVATPGEYFKHWKKFVWQRRLRGLAGNSLARNQLA